MEKELLEPDYLMLSQRLAIGLTYTKFGNATLESITRLCKELGLNAVQTIDVEDAWARHSKRFASSRAAGKRP